MQDSVVVNEGKLEVRPMMTLALSFDQRTIAGAHAARFLHDVKLLLEGSLEDSQRPCWGLRAIRQRWIVAGSAERAKCASLMCFTVISICLRFT